MEKAKINGRPYTVLQNSAGTRGLVDQPLKGISYLVIIRAFPHLEPDGTVRRIKADRSSIFSEAVRFRRCQPN